MTISSSGGSGPGPRELEAWLAAAIGGLCGLEARLIDIRERFTRYGLDSRGATELATQLGALLGRRVSPTLVYEHPSIDALVQHLIRDAHDQKPANVATTARGGEGE